MPQPAGRPLQPHTVPTDATVRRDLAAAYALCDHFGWTDTIYTHLSARSVERPGHYYVNAFGLHFGEVTPANLVEVTEAGLIVHDPTGLGINPAGLVIHSCLHRARADVACVMHTHTRAGVAVSAQAFGLLPLSQHAARVLPVLGYHDYEGIALERDEEARLVADLGDKQVLILRNHGLLSAGASVREAFELMSYLETACRVQVDALCAGHDRLHVMTTQQVAQAYAQFCRPGRLTPERDWPAYLRLLQRLRPDVFAQES